MEMTADIVKEIQKSHKSITDEILEIASVLENNVIDLKKMLTSVFDSQIKSFSNTANTAFNTFNDSVNMFDTFQTELVSSIEKEFTSGIKKFIAENNLNEAQSAELMKEISEKMKPLMSGEIKSLGDIEKVLGEILGLDKKKLEKDKADEFDKVKNEKSNSSNMKMFEKDEEPEEDLFKDLLPMLLAGGLIGKIVNSFPVRFLRKGLTGLFATPFKVIGKMFSNDISTGKNKPSNWFDRYMRFRDIKIERNNRELLKNIKNQKVKPPSKFVSFFKGLNSALKFVSKKVGTIIKGIGKGIMKAIPGIGTLLSLIDVASIAFNPEEVKKITGKADNTWYESLGAGVSGFLSDLSFGLFEAKDIYKFFSNIGGELMKLWETYVPKIWDSVSEKFVEIKDGFVDRTVKMFQDFWDWIGNLLGDAVNSLKSKIGLGEKTQEEKDKDSKNIEIDKLKASSSQTKDGDKKILKELENKGIYEDNIMYNSDRFDASKIDQLSKKEIEALIKQGDFDEEKRLALFDAYNKKDKPQVAIPTKTNEAPINTETTQNKTKKLEEAEPKKGTTIIYNTTNKNEIVNATRTTNHTQNTKVVTDYSVPGVG